METKRYDVSGMDLGDGKPAPAGTMLKLSGRDAERLGVKAKPRKAAAEPESTDAAAKPRKAAGTRKRQAPAKRAVRKSST